MLLQLKKRFGVFLIIAGGLLATLGQCLRLWNSDPAAGGWFLSMALVVLGTFLLLYGITLYAQLSDRIDLVGLIGSGLIFLGGVFTIAGTIAINVIVVPLLLGIASTIAASVNSLGTAAQTGTNATSSGLNTVKNGITSIFGQNTSSSDIPTVTVPQLNGLTIVNQTLAGLHLPSFAQITQWGHVFFTGGPLTLGCLLLGLSMLRTQSGPRSACTLLIAAAILNFISQCLISVFPVLSTITGILLFISLSLLGTAILFPQVFNKINIDLPSALKLKHAR
ncbi:hypothetical protein ccbrp13_02890 [Ktedonobacteria bacterium brp13]|nr:hypothetical protein ccbrp13_02890 [Ktedonobacteria bacterium brp13]